MESPAPAQTTAQTSALSERVRALVREQRIDPRSQARAVRDLALGVVAEHDRRSLSGAVGPIDQPDLVVNQIMADVAGFGPLQALLDDPEIEEVWINEPDRVFVARDGRPELTSIVLSDGQVRELVERMLSSTGRRLDVSRPFVDATLPGGHRLHVVLQGISRDFGPPSCGRASRVRPSDQARNAPVPPSIRTDVGGSTINARRTDAGPTDVREQTRRRGGRRRLSTRSY